LYDFVTVLLIFFLFYSSCIYVCVCHTQLKDIRDASPLTFTANELCYQLSVLITSKL